MPDGKLWLECEPDHPEAMQKIWMGNDCRWQWLRPAPDYRALLELARTNPHRFVGTEHSCRLCGNESGDVIHRAAYRALAVEALKALEQAQCSCKKAALAVCPQCGGHLQRVRNTSPWLNDDQFDSVRAGDFYCEYCKGAEARSGYKYWWERDLKEQRQTCNRCVLLSRPDVAALLKEER